MLRVPNAGDQDEGLKVIILINSEDLSNQLHPVGTDIVEPPDKGRDAPGAGFRRQLRRTRHGAATSAQRHVTRSGTTLAVTMRWMRNESVDGAGASLAWAELAAGAPAQAEVAASFAASVSAFRDAPIALVAISAAGQVIEVNQDAVELLQQPRGRLVGQPWHSCVGDTADADTLASTLMSDEDWSGPVTVRYSDGSSCELDGRTHVRADGTRVVALHDVSERVRTEGELRRSNDRYRRLSDHARHVREEERARLSRDLHDRLGQALTGLKMDLAWLLALCDRFEPSTANLDRGNLILNVVVTSLVGVVVYVAAAWVLRVREVRDVLSYGRRMARRAAGRPAGAKGGER